MEKIISLCSEDYKIVLHATQSNTRLREQQAIAPQNNWAPITSPEQLSPEKLPLDNGPQINGFQVISPYNFPPILLPPKTIASQTFCSA